MEVINFMMMHKYALLTLLGAVIVATGAFASSIEQKRSEEKLEKANEEIRQKSNLIIALQDENNKELKHQTNMLTGGNTFPIFAVLGQKNTPHIFKPALFARGKYPLLNFSMKIKLSNWDPSKIDEYVYEIPELQQIIPNPWEEDLVFDLEKFPNLGINIRTRARNGVWNQQIKFRKTADGNFQYETSVIPFFSDGKPLWKKKFDEKYTEIGSMSDLDSLRYKK